MKSSNVLFIHTTYGLNENLGVFFPVGADVQLGSSGVPAAAFSASFIFLCFLVAKKPISHKGFRPLPL